MQIHSPQPASSPSQKPGGTINAAERLKKDISAPGTPTLRRRVKNLGKRGLRQLFELGQRFGVDVLPRHFYSQIPDIQALRLDHAWKAPYSMIGVGGAEVDAQFEFLESCCTPELRARLGRGDIYNDACAANGEPGFGAVDADLLFGFIQFIRPRRIVQVGCGVSTAVILRAARELNESLDYRPEVVCVEPYPTDFLKAAAHSGAIRLIAEPAQTVSLETLTDLGDGGFLFVDSTHAVKPGSEVNRLILEVLPRLSAGSWVHFHDIYFPYDYQRGLLDDELFFSNETALLHAFLCHNSRYMIRASHSMLHHADPSRLGRSMPNYVPARNDSGLRTTAGDFPGSIYLEAV